MLVRYIYRQVNPIFIALILLIALVFTQYIVIEEAVYDDKNLTFMAKDVYINGEHINNFQLAAPVRLNAGSTFIPLNPEFSGLMGFSAMENGEYIVFYQLKMGSAGDKTIVRAKDFNPDPSSAPNWSIDDVISAGHVGGKKLVLETSQEKWMDINESDLLLAGDGTLYMRLSSLCNVPETGISAFYDDISGLYISTNPKTSAKDTLNENNRSYIEGRAAYIRHANRSVSEYMSFYLEYLFRKEALINDLSQDTLMALCRTETHFTVDPEGKAIGLMQIMPTTATGSGWTIEEVSTIHGNIAFGAKYLASKLKQFNGDEVKTFSSYNQGSGKVKSGNYSTTYAEKVISYRVNMVGWIKKQGYTGTFEN